MFIDKLDDTVNKYNNTYHRIIRMDAADVKSSIYVDFITKMLRKVLNLKLVIMQECQTIKIFLQKVKFQIGQKKLL